MKNKTITEYSERERFIEIEKVRILVDNLSASMPSTFINSLIVITVIWSAMPAKKLITWALMNIIFVFIRYYMLSFYKKGYKKEDFIFWKKIILVSFIIAGTLFGSVGIFLIKPSLYEHMIFVYFVAGGMVAGSLGSYHNNLSMFFAYAGTVFLIPTVSIFLINTEITTPMAILGLIFFTITSISAKRMNRDLSEFLVLRFDNNNLVKKINKEKNQSEKLNYKLTLKNKELKELALIDPLTSLKNRRYLFEIFTPEFEKKQKNLQFEQGMELRKEVVENGYGILLIDIDHFKTVNDNFGHDSGDLALEQFSKILIETVREDDIVGRIGGEEFIIILKKTSETYLSVLSEKIRKSVEHNNFNIIDGKVIKMTCSVGFIFYPFFKIYPGKLNFHHVFSLADKALYYAKESGRNLSAKVVSNERNCDDPDAIKIIASDITKAIDKKQIGFELCKK